MTTPDGYGPNGCDGCWGFRSNADVDANGQKVSAMYPCKKCRSAEYAEWLRQQQPASGHDIALTVTVIDMIQQNGPR